MLFWNPGGVPLLVAVAYGARIAAAARQPRPARRPSLARQQRPKVTATSRKLSPQGPVEATTSVELRGSWPGRRRRPGRGLGPGPSLGPAPRDGGRDRRADEINEDEDDAGHKSHGRR
jgi:hypothetical protein